MQPFEHLLDFLRRLDDAQIHYTLGHYRDESIMVLVDVPGERWEIEFLTDGEVQVEIFRSDGTLHGEGVLPELFRRHEDRGSS